MKYKIQRLILGVLCLLLPWISILGDFNFTSISMTATSNPWLNIVLGAACCYLFTYGYDFWNRIIFKLSGVFGLILLMFPCDTALLNVSNSLLSNWYSFLDVYTSSTIHYIGAFGFFGLMLFGITFLFCKCGKHLFTNGKKIRNGLYISFGILSILGILLCFIFPYQNKIWFGEMISLSFVGCAWIVKSNFWDYFKYLKVEYGYMKKIVEKKYQEKIEKIMLENNCNFEVAKKIEKLKI